LLFVNNKPEISGIYPSSAIHGVYEQKIVLSGTGFKKESKVSLSGGGIVIVKSEMKSETGFVITINVDSRSPLEKRSIEIVNPDGGRCIVKDILSISKADKESVYYGNIDKFKKPASVVKKKIFKNTPFIRR
jgi:hypothetical protein